MIYIIQNMSVGISYLMKASPISPVLLSGFFLKHLRRNLEKYLFLYVQYKSTLSALCLLFLFLSIQVHSTALLTFPSKMYWQRDTYICKCNVHYCTYCLSELLSRVTQSTCGIRYRFSRAIWNKGYLHMLESSRRTNAAIQSKAP